MSVRAVFGNPWFVGVGSSLLVALLATCIPAAAQADCCTATNNGAGSVDLPADCPFHSAGRDIVISNGLPPGTTIILSGPLENFSSVLHAPGGTLGGGIDTFDAQFQWSVTGTGSLEGFKRTIWMPVSCEVHNAPRSPGDPVQIFAADMVHLHGQLFGDPDFCELIIRAGASFALPSPGQTMLRELPSGHFAVDSFFDITYEIEFEGCPGSVLDGYSGTSIDGIRFGTQPCEECCTAPDNGSGTADLPPNCPYGNPYDDMKILNGLPPGSTIILRGSLDDFTGITHAPGGTLGGGIDTFDGYLKWWVTGTGSLAGFNRTIWMPVSCEVHNAPRPAGEPVQTFSNVMVHLEGELFGDPDFCTLRITGGAGSDPARRGRTTLAAQPAGHFVVDSFFDLTYEIEFEGCPGSALDGCSGITTDRTQLATCEHVFPEPPCCSAQNNTHDTVDFPPDCPYANTNEPVQIVNGLPAGTAILLEGPLEHFTSISNAPGGTLGGGIDTFDAQFRWSVTGTGSLEGFTRIIWMPVACEVHTAPRTPGDPVQTFATHMFRLHGQLFGDPDFCELIIRAGADFALPSPGQTRLTQLASGDFAVDSFFDVTYEIEFEGCPGSVLDGYEGATRGTNRLFTCEAEAAPLEPVEIRLRMDDPDVELGWDEVFRVRTYEVHSSPHLGLGLSLDLSGAFPSNTTWRAPISGSNRFYRVHGQALW